MDHHIGRLMAYLQQRGLTENTILLVTSDNGPEPSEPPRERGFTQWMAAQGYTRRLENLGERHSYVFIGPEWASATASPGALFKFYTADGSLHVPFIIAGPDIAARRIDARAFVTDVAPTLLERAGATAAPQGAMAMNGLSMNAMLAGRAQRVHEPGEAVGIEVSGNAALFRGDYKLVRNMPPYGDGAWRLYDINADPGETHDLSRERPQLLAAMQADYAAYAVSVGVLDLPAGYDVQRQVARNALMMQLKYYWWVLALATLMLLALAYGAWRGVRALMRR
jgi:arylsulfatase/uncharacterized sulfatase